VSSIQRIKHHRRKEGAMQSKTALLMSAFPLVAEQPVFCGSKARTWTADNHKAIVDLATGKVFSIVSQDYRLIRHEDAIEFIEEAIQKNLGAYVTNTSFYNDGGRMLHSFRFPGISVQIDRGDSVSLELHLFNSYDMTWPFIVLLGAFRLVCSNGLVIGKKYYQFRKRHIFHLADVGLEADLCRSIGQFHLQAKEWRKWAEISMTMKVFDRVMRTMQFGARATEEIEERIWCENGNPQGNVPLVTLWAFYNVLTWYITHRVASLNRRVELENRLRLATRNM
jgi:hypothetical protein